MTQATFETLTQQLRHPDGSQRGQAAITLGGMDDARVLDVLLDALVDETDVMVREDLTWALVRVGAPAVEPLVALLGHDTATVRHSAAHALGKIADGRAVEALSGTLSDANTAVVLKAAFALGQIGERDAIPAVAQLLGHPEPDVQATVNAVLEQFPTDALPLLVDALGHTRQPVREHAADALGLLGDAAAIPALAAALRDPAWQVRFAAATALGQIDSADARRALLTARDDADTRVRALAAKLA